MRIILLILAVVILTDPALGADVDNLGRAPYGIKNRTFRCAAFKRSLGKIKNIRLAFLSRSFGKASRCIKALLANPRTTLVEMHLANGTCCPERGRGCGRQELMFGETCKSFEKKVLRNDPHIMRRFRKLLQADREWLYQKIRPETKCLINPMLESIGSPRLGRRLVRTTREYFGDRCLIGWNPLYAQNAVRVGQDFTELHGSRARLKPPCVANLDGQDIKFSGFRSLNSSIDAREIPRYIERFKHCIVNFLWIQLDNCLGRRREDPSQRQCQDDGRFKLVGDLIRKAERGK